MSKVKVTYGVDPNLVIPPFKDEERNALELTDPPRYGILIHAEHEGTMIYALFPDLDPKDPSARPSSLCVSPDVVDIERLISIYNDLKELIPEDKCKVNVVHLSKEQLAVIALHDYDQDKLFNYLYDGGKQNNELFEVIAIAEVITNEDEVCSE